MASAPELTALADTPPFSDSITAPFIYFDIAPTYGVFAGAVQIEIASRVLVPGDAGAVDTRFVATGHLRCSAAAAAHLRDAINKSLEMLAQLQGQAQPPTAAEKLN